MAHFEDGGALISELRSAIYKKKDADPDGLNRSNIGGWHSNTDMLSWAGPAAQELINRVIALARRMSHFKGDDVNRIDWDIQMWANVSCHGASNHMHVHPGNIWSAVLYVDMGGRDASGNDTDGLGGEFYFEDPRFPATAMHNPGFRMIGMDGKPQAVQPEIRPKKGDVLMFPSWLKHGVRPYFGDKERISIAMNLDAKH